MHTAPFQARKTLCEEDIQEIESQPKKTKKQDQMHELFLKAVNTGGCFKKEHVLDLVNTMLGRKQANFTLR